jgi:hypothetical protein
MRGRSVHVVMVYGAKALFEVIIGDRQLNVA